jgi:hypothetical protein
VKNDNSFHYFLIYFLLQSLYEGFTSLYFFKQKKKGGEWRKGFELLEIQIIYKKLKNIFVLNLIKGVNE